MPEKNENHFVSDSITEDEDDELVKQVIAPNTEIAKLGKRVTSMSNIIGDQDIQAKRPENEFKRRRTSSMNNIETIEKCKEEI